ncbi:hypothetical protein IAW_05816 [Bacillus cereus str. Schrouff]|uniref:hypothetical protein n=1 Tax=Bacillus cereus TaxID=1396 RepID=UPI000330DD3E|nr:hypothetical protein [Bacillus cereus]EOO04998.1 hypothetical protein IAW_05816 [Bacillus cereus str. Schrouff]EOO81668.1 hypothetical protein IGY_05690 [Bacillus cereus K-5975c]
MKKKLSMKKKIKATVTTVTTAGILLTSVTPSFAEEQKENQQYQIKSNSKQQKEIIELTNAEGNQLNTKIEGTLFADSLDDYDVNIQGEFDLRWMEWASDLENGLYAFSGEIFF